MIDITTNLSDIQIEMRILRIAYQRLEAYVNDIGVNTPDFYSEAVQAVSRLNGAKNEHI